MNHPINSTILKPNIILKFLKDSIHLFTEEDLDELEMLLFSEVMERDQDINHD